MTIIEAILSGKPFKRKIWDDLWAWSQYREEGNVFSPSGREMVLRNFWNGEPRARMSHYSVEDILATDWEVQES